MVSTTLKPAVPNPIATASEMTASAVTEPLAQNLSGLPGVVGVAWARRALLSGPGGGAAARVEMPGQPVFASHYNQVSANYFAVTGARVLAGRTMQESDSADSTPVVMLRSSADFIGFAGDKIAGATPMLWARG